jgi:UDPglucose--hexose-1-phosphate uridylyltransferase
VAGELRVDPLSGRQVVIAAERGRRPGASAPTIAEPTEDELASCPFCEGCEERTPPETLALPDREPPDSPGWAVRVVPNLYPAFERQEVVIHSPRHVRSFAELDDAQVELVAAAWRVRAASARAEGRAYVHALVNEGRDAGASLAHSHSQLVWMREPPPALTAEREDGLAALLADRDPYEFDVGPAAVALCHPAGRAPYEVIVASVDGEDSDGLESQALPALLLALRDVVRRLRAIEGPVPWNAWMHAGARLHLELVPRLTAFAGIELGAGIYVNPLAPERAAEALRAAL